MKDNEEYRIVENDSFKGILKSDLGLSFSPSEGKVLMQIDVDRFSMLFTMSLDDAKDLQAILSKTIQESERAMP